MGLSTWDKSFFGLRKGDRPSNSRSKSQQRPTEVETPPALPPLGLLNKKSSFANLLEQLENSPKPKDNEGAMLATVAESENKATAPDPLPIAVLPESKPEPVQHNTALESASIVAEQKVSLEDTVANKSDITAPSPVRKESITSSSIRSKESGSLSKKSSSSSVSSLEDVLAVTLREAVHKSGQSTIMKPVKSAVRKREKAATPLIDDSALRHERSASMFFSSSDMNKPLPAEPVPPMPFLPSSKGKEPMRRDLNTSSESPIRSIKSVRRPVPEDQIDGIDRRNMASVPARKPVHNIRPVAADMLVRSGQSEPTTVRYKSLQLKHGHRTGKNVSADSAEKVILQILHNLDSISDMKSAALVNRGFYRVFQRNETELVSKVIRSTSIPAWELRQLIKHEQRHNPFRMKSIQRDMAALKALQAFILMKCDDVCRASTLEGLIGGNPRRRQEIEDALWRIWMFCKLFGKGTLRDNSMQAQVLWLEGKVRYLPEEPFASETNPKPRGVTMKEIEDMSELWRCMEVLLSGFRGREDEARQVGIFTYCNIDESIGKSEAYHLEDWISDILSVGPKAVLTLISCSFDHAKVLGVTKWTPPRPGKNRRNFLKGALEQVYRERLVQEARTKAEEFSRSMQPSSLQGRVSPETTPVADAVAQSLGVSVERDVEEKISTRIHGNEFESTQFRPNSELQRSLTMIKSETQTNSFISDPAVLSSLVMTSRASVRLGATLFPVKNEAETDEEDFQDAVDDLDIIDPIDLELEPKVVDPTDRAISLLVKQLGFPANKARQALAMSDDGAGINVRRAIELLSIELGWKSDREEVFVAELPGHMPTSSTDSRQDIEYCEGTCGQVSVIQRTKSKKRSLLSRNSIKQTFSMNMTLNDDDHVTSKSKSVKSVSTTVTAITPTDSPEPKQKQLGLTEIIMQGLRPQNSISSQYSFRRNHRKSASTGTVEMIREDETQVFSPVSPMSPTAGIAQMSRASSMDDFTMSGALIPTEGETETPKMNMRPVVTLTRVGTGRRPAKGLSLSRSAGKAPEIIGYTYANAA